MKVLVIEASTCNSFRAGGFGSLPLRSTIYRHHRREGALLLPAAGGSTNKNIRTGCMICPVPFRIGLCENCSLYCRKEQAASLRFDPTIPNMRDPEGNLRFTIEILQRTIDI